MGAAERKDPRRRCCAAAGTSPTCGSSRPTRGWRSTRCSCPRRSATGTWVTSSAFRISAGLSRGAGGGTARARRSRVGRVGSRRDRRRSARGHHVLLRRRAAEDAIPHRARGDVEGRARRRSTSRSGLRISPRTIGRTTAISTRRSARPSWRRAGTCSTCRARAA